MKRILVSTTVLILVLILLIAQTVVCRAAAITFAQFSMEPNNGGMQLIDPTSSTTTTTLTSDSDITKQTSGAFQVAFSFQGGASTPTLQSTQFNKTIDGLLTFTATTTEKGSKSGSQVQQTFSNVSFQITVANTTNNANLGLTVGSVLLSATSNGSGSVPVGGTLSGTAGGTTATFSGADVNTGNSSLYNTVTYSSAYINFNNASQKAYNYAFSSLSADLELSTSKDKSGDPYIDCFTGDTTAAFSASFLVVPEPGMPTFCASIGLFGLGLYIRRRRRTVGVGIVNSGS